MNITKTHRIIAAIAGAGVSLAVLAGCTPDDLAASGPPASTSQQKAAPSSPAQAQPDVVPFGSPFTYDNGVTVTASIVGPYTPSPLAVGAAGFTQFLEFSITVNNGSKVVFDPSMIAVSASAGEQSATQIFDSTNNMGGTPSTAVTPGGTITFKQAFGVTSTTGVTLQVNVMNAEMMGTPAIFQG